MYEQIIKDENIIEILKQVNKNNPSFAACHGLEHAKRVSNYCEIILKKLGETYENIELGKISGFLHDVGTIDGKSNHAKKSAIYVKKYLTEKGMCKKNNEIIVQAIEDHSNGNNIKSNIGAALLLADKIDISKNRILIARDDDEFHKNLLNVENVEIDIDEYNLKVNFITNGKFKVELLKEWPKPITIAVKVAEYLRKGYKFFVDGNETDLSFLITE